MAERSYRIKVAAQMSGVSEPLIRAWERRYGVPRPERTGSGYRLYSESEIAVLRRLKALLDEGMAIGEAAKLVPELRRTAPPAPDATQVDHWRARLLEAAAQSDQRAVEGVLDEAFTALPPLVVHDKLLVPSLKAVGDAWHAGTLTVAQEHLVTQPIRVRLLGLLHGAPLHPRAHVLCACLPAEEHDVGLLGAALRFRQAGFRVTYLGARTPADALGRMAAQTGTSLVALSAIDDLGARGLRAALSQVRQALPKKARVLIGGRGAELYPQVCEEAGVRLVRSEDDWSEALK
jgi:DNA-binding transcriptional MerR regulator/methylmalonyl-CoA mutase cobalamin-binding subunit